MHDTQLLLTLTDDEDDRWVQARCMVPAASWQGWPNLRWQSQWHVVKQLQKPSGQNLDSPARLADLQHTGKLLHWASKRLDTCE